jgi:hypothetical protein
MELVLLSSKLSPMLLSFFSNEGRVTYCTLFILLEFSGRLPMWSLRFPSSLEALEASSLEGLISSTVDSVLVRVGDTVEGEFSLDSSTMLQVRVGDTVEGKFSLDNSSMLQYLCKHPTS